MTKVEAIKWIATYAPDKKLPTMSTSVVVVPPIVSNQKIRTLSKVGKKTWQESIY